ncbi:MAG: hypothetical protein R3F56_16410 [Planctomycetota bacterium]
MNTPTGDSDFDKFRRERRQRRAQFGSLPATAAAKSHGVSDIEAYEARQMHETKLTRDVHDFLADATKHAATIVEKVTQVAEAETAQRLAREMHEFLEETMRRAARFMEMVQSRRGETALQELEPHLSNIVGTSLDEFRFEGTAQLADKHIGQDPFFEDDVATSDDSLDIADAEAGDVVDLEDVDVQGEVDVRDPTETPAPRAREPHAAREPSPRTLAPTPTAPAEPKAAARQPDRTADAPTNLDAQTPGAAMAGMLGERMFKDPETLKNALKALVRSGVLTPDDARETYRAALQKAAH